MESQGSKKESKIPGRVDNKSDEGVKWNIRARDEETQRDSWYFPFR